MTHFIARIRTGCEQAFSERLTGCGVGNYCPTVTMITRPARMRFPVKVQRPRFPSYLFVAIETAQFLHPVYQDSRFNGFLKQAGMVGTVRSEEIAALKAYDGCETVPEPVKRRLSNGDLAKPKNWIFNDKKGYVRLGNDGQVWLEGLDYPLPVQFSDADALILLESSGTLAA